MVEEKIGNVLKEIKFIIDYSVSKETLKEQFSKCVDEIFSHGQPYRFEGFVLNVFQSPFSQESEECVLTASNVSDMKDVYRIYRTMGNFKFIG